ncbi:hypothetical protein [Salinimicrobium sp. HB62]|uniref:hypothetical protein n=1 Tax=Salinimicrobium sp. HB62 TaxID=3077781 RepID=UPI002D790183|nr:hypothetical protein [Salinimicrobium sp. HB62]
MKNILNIILGISLLVFTQTCSNNEKEEESSASAVAKENAMEVTGTIREQGITSYQYGTHTITTVNDEYYALKSEAVDLDEYIDKEVTIIAEKIEGYPLSGGPDYLLVLEVK